MHLLVHSPSSGFLRLPIGCLSSMLKVKMLKMTTFFGGGLERKTESFSCIQSSAGSGERGALSVSEREREAVFVNPIILCYHMQFSSQDTVCSSYFTQVWHSMIWLELLVPLSAPVFCLPAGKADTITTSHQIQNTHNQTSELSPICWKIRSITIYKTSLLLQIPSSLPHQPKHSMTWEVTVVVFFF